MYTRSELVEEAVREMALALAAHERERLAAVAQALEPTIAWLEDQLEHSPTAATVAATLGVEIEDVLDIRLAPKLECLAVAA